MAESWADLAECLVGYLAMTAVVQKAETTASMMAVQMVEDWVAVMDAAMVEH